MNDKNKNSILLGNEEKSNEENLDNYEIEICESCWKQIEGYSFELDGLKMCSQCFEYHGGFDGIDN